MDVSWVHVTKASIQIESPSFTGDKKSTESVEAVTTGLRACLTAAIAATSSMCAINLPPNKVPYVFVSGGKTFDVFTVNEFEHGLLFILTSLQHAYLPHYKIGESKRDIDSLNFITIERLSYNFCVICVDSFISSLNAFTNFFAIYLSYKNAFTSKFKRKLRTSIFAVPTEEIWPSTTIVFACKKPF